MGAEREIILAVEGRAGCGAPPAIYGDLQRHRLGNCHDPLVQISAGFKLWIGRPGIATD